MGVASAFDYAKNRSWGEEFSRHDIKSFERELRTKNESFWNKIGEARALSLFHKAANNVPAYKDFLKKNGIRRPSQVKTVSDFQSVPITDKKNYISAYPIEERCWGGELSKSHLTAISSGTSGEQQFWPRGGYQEFEAGVIHELIYRYYFEIHKYTTLLVVGFPMGVYVSGVATVLPSTMIAEKGYKMCIITAGNNKPEVLRTIKNLGRLFDQIVLVGHPFFVKDVIESGSKHGVVWKKKRLRMMFCSGGFNETWRRVVMKEAGQEIMLSNVISTYGSSELLLIGHESPISIFVRKLSEKNEVLRKSLFLQDVVPHFFQYNPLFRYIEEVMGDLVFTSASGLPLVRFNIKDSGQILSQSSVIGSLDSVDPGWRKELKKMPLWNLPFVGLNGRSDYTVVFYAANIYPEHVELGLHHKEFVRALTGKFAMRKTSTRKINEGLEINVELRDGIRPTKELARRLQDRIVHTLCEVNREFLDASKKFHGSLKPRIKLWKYQHEKYFKQGLKPRFILK